MLKDFPLVIALLLCCCTIQAQDIHEWTLEECIKYGEEHNIDILRQSLALDRNGLSVQEGKWAFVPHFSASSGYTMSTGRVLDPTTYQFVETQFTGNSSSSVSGEIALFEGGRKIRNLNRAKLSLKAAILQKESSGLSMRLNIAAAYMDVLCTQEQKNIAEITADLIKKQLKRSEEMLSAGSITESDVLQLRSELFGAKNDIESAEYSHEMALLTLCDILNIEDYLQFRVADLSEEEMFMPLMDVETVTENNPDYRMSVVNMELAEEDYKLAKSALSPSLSLSAGYGSSFSDARKKAIQNPDGTIKYEAYPFFQQYADNASAYASLGLKIPILTGLTARNSVKKARIAMRESEYSMMETRKQIRKKILQAQMDCNLACQKYMRTKEEVRYAEEAQRQIDEKYNSGVTDYLSWDTAVITLAKARYSQTEARYEYLLKLQILNSYL